MIYKYVSTVISVLFLLGCDGGITIDGTIYEASLGSSDSSFAVNGQRTLSNSSYTPLSGASFFVFSGERTKAEIDTFIDANQNLQNLISSIDGTYHYDETTYSGRESFTIIYWKSGYKTAIATFSKSQAYSDETICAVLVRDSISNR